MMSWRSRSGLQRGNRSNQPRRVKRVGTRSSRFRRLLASAWTPRFWSTVRRMRRLFFEPLEVRAVLTAPNQAPFGTDNLITLLEDQFAYTFTRSDFGFLDPDGNALLAVRIVSTPAAGSLTLSNVAVLAGQFIPNSDIDAGLFKFMPAANGFGSPYATIRFQVQDDGGIDAGGVDLDPTSNSITFNVTPVNDAPSGSDKTISISAN